MNHSVEIQQRHDDDENNGQIDLSDNGEDEFDFNAEYPMPPYKPPSSSSNHYQQPLDEEDTLIQYDDDKENIRSISPEPTNEWAQVEQYKKQHQRYRDSELLPPIQSSQKTQPALPRQVVYQPQPPIQLPSCQTNLSTILEDTRRNASMQPTFEDPRRSTVGVQRNYENSRRAASVQSNLEESRRDATIQRNLEDNHRTANVQRNLEESRRNATVQSNFEESRRNATTGPHNQSSFSVTKLAELDNKFKHLRVPIDRMNIDDIMSEIKSSQDAIYNKPAERYSPAKPSYVPASPKVRNTYASSFIKPVSHTSSFVKPASHATLMTPTMPRDMSNLSEAISEPIMTQKSSFISVDKPVLAFGFVSNKMSRAISVKISNDSDLSLWLQPTVIQHHNYQNKNPLQSVFSMSDTSSFSLEPRSSHTLTVVFEPKAVLTYNGQLRLKLLSKDEPEFVIRMFGYGARAELKLCTRSFEKIEMGTDGVGICEIERDAKFIEMVLINRGQRDAFAYIYAVDNNDQPMPEYLVSVNPNRVVVQKNTKEYVKFTVNFHQSLVSMGIYKTQSNSQMSINTVHSGRTLQNEIMGRLRIVWGEERLRRRLKSYLEKNPGENVPSDIEDYVARPYRNEGTFHNEKIVGRWDLQRFTDSIRVMTVQLIDTHIRPQNQHRQANNNRGEGRQQSNMSAYSNINQSFAQTIPASQILSQITTLYSSTTNEDETLC